jgi:N-ethylmaleimide reductase
MHRAMKSTSGSGVPGGTGDGVVGFLWPETRFDRFQEHTPMPMIIPGRAELVPLFRPARLGSLRVPHRVAMAPMTRSRAGEGGIPSELAIEYYRQRASAAFIVTEAVQVSPEGVGYPGTPGIYTLAQADGWSRVVRAVRDAGGRIFLQLWHVGRISHPDFHGGALPVAPSVIRPAGSVRTPEGVKSFVSPRALEVHELPRLVEDFRRAAALALYAGFDGVEIHAANGYLLDQFLRDGTNRREDAYGGSIENRLRLPLEVVDAVVSVWGAHRVGIRVSPLSAANDMSDSNPRALFDALAQALRERDLAYLHVVTENGFVGELPAFDPLSLGEVFGGSVVAAGGYDAEAGARDIAAGRADFVAYARSFLANPDLPRRFADDAQLNEADPDTFFGGGAAGYVDYPSLEAGGEDA